MSYLTYPFDGASLMKRRRAVRRELIAAQEASGARPIEKRIAILGGPTTHDIRDMLELFLLDEGIRAETYECGYDQWWQEVMFDSPALREFRPDVIFIHTTTRNIPRFPGVRDTPEQVDALLAETYAHWEQAWERAAETYRCPVIQNNFEPPYWRLLGNRDAADVRGRRSFVGRLNARLYEYARTHENFHIHDSAWLAADWGLRRWADPAAWHLYKCEPAPPAVPEFAHSVAAIIKSLYGRNKKALVCDLDGTLWGGVVGDDGADGIEVGQETGTAQLYAEFQSYIRAHRDIGVLLAVDSKNDEENALAGLSRPDSVLRPEDFTVIKANWESKDRNLAAIARELNLGEDALVFVDDSPAERAIVRANTAAAVPELGEPEGYLATLDRAGYFEVTGLSADDLARTEMYRANAARRAAQGSFADYGEYLRSLEMRAEVAPFSPPYMARIAQLTNKSNQFNLTTLRLSQSDVERMAADPSYVTLYGRLADRFGDNGVVSVVAGHVAEGAEVPKAAGGTGAGASTLHIDLWLMSCRVLKRGMEDAMLDALVAACRARGVAEAVGYYHPTSKNAMVREFYGAMGFERVDADAAGNSVWRLRVAEYTPRNAVIAVDGAASSGGRGPGGMA